VRDHLAVDLNSLANVAQVRRGIEPGLITGALQYGRQHMAGRALAIGAGDMNGFKMLLGVV